MMRHARWGILGTARIAEQQIIPAIRAAKNAEVVAVASRTRDKAEEFARRFEIPEVFDSYEALLQSPTIDVVYIPLPNHLHKHWAILAAKNGKHVFCEKPAALDAEQTGAMVGAARDHGVLFAEAFMYHYHVQWQRVHDILESGEIGEIKLIDCNFSFTVDNPQDIRHKPEMGGGSLYDLGCYCVHVINQLVSGAEPIDVTATAEFEGQVVDKSLSAAIKFSNGVIANFDTSFVVPMRQRVEIVGTKGSITLPAPFRPDLGDPRVVICSGQEGRERVERFEQIPMYQLEVEDFSESVLTSAPCKNSAEDSLRNMRLLDAIYTAAGRVKVF